VTTHHGQTGKIGAARTSSYAPSVNGDVVRDTWFLRSSWWRSITGYAVPEVDDLLGRVAAELDADRPAGPLIENATFRRIRMSRGYDIDAVDWFFDQLLLRPGHTGMAGISADPWRDLAVAQLSRGKVTDAAEQPRNPRAFFAEECAKAWHDFGQQPGMYLRWGRAGRRRLRGARYELRTPEQQTIASRDGQRLTVGAGGAPRSP
jgi:DivIVA domain-containing protein